MKSARRVGVLGVAMSLLPALLAACGAEEADEAIDVAGGAIVGGTTLTSGQLTTYGLVALYHRDGPSAPWFTRPCSAVILRSSGGVSKVLTARHCVTVGGAIDGTPVFPSDLRLIPAVSPGIANPNPPSGTVTPASITLMTTSGTSQSYHDMAIVTVNVDWSSRVASKQGILVRNPSTMAGDDEPLLAFGYGLSIDDQQCFGDPAHTTGAGTARFGGPFEPSSGSIAGSGATYVYPNLSPTGQKVICGDSGGPDIGWLGDDDFTWAHVVGVHSAGTTNMTNTATGKWLQDQLGGVYLSSYWDRTKNVAANGTTGLQILPASSGIQLKYYADTQQIIAVSANKCLTSSLTLATCSTSTSQKWTGSNQRLGAVSGGGCLTHAGTGTLALQACSSTAEMSQRQMWAWHPQR
jgi:hypothetical protein